MPFRPVHFYGHIKVLKLPSHVREAKGVPVWTDGESCLSCWKMGIWDRIKFLFHGNVWMWIQTGESMPPVFLESERRVFEIADETPKSPK